jgi:hypothetical protein
LKIWPGEKSPLGTALERVAVVSPLASTIAAPTPKPHVNFAPIIIFGGGLVSMKTLLLSFRQKRHFQLPGLDVQFQPEPIKSEGTGEEHAGNEKP